MSNWNENWGEAGDDASSKFASYEFASHPIVPSPFTGADRCPETSGGYPCHQKRGAHETWGLGMEMHTYSDPAIKMAWANAPEGDERPIYSGGVGFNVGKGS